MHHLVQKISLVSVGAVIGGLLGVAVAASAAHDATESGLPYTELRQFTFAHDEIMKSYVEPVDEKKLMAGAINGMLASLDPHSNYFDEKSLKEFEETIRGSFGGLGMQVDMAPNGLVTVIAPIEDTPAWKAGVKPGDMVYKIDSTPVSGLSLEQAVKMMRGDPGTSVTLTLLRKGEAQPLVLKLTREEIKVKSVKYAMADPETAYIRVSSFQETTVEEFKAVYAKLYAQNKGNIKGMILDLRDDPGGLLDQAVGIVSAFVPEKSLVVYADGRLPTSKSRHYASALKFDTPEMGALLQQVPLVVLVDSGSASASEIVAGALQDYKRGILVGDRTFGKGSVQQLIQLPPDGKTAIKITVQKYFTPSGRSIQAKGIEPDVEVAETTVTAEDGAKGFKRSESELSGHLSNPLDPNAGTKGNDADADSALPEVPDAKKPPKNQDQAELSKKDYQLRQALTVLKVQQILKKQDKVVIANP